MLVDTNIVISALFFEGNERRLIELLSKDGDLVLSEAVLQETRYVAAGWPDGEETAARFETTFSGNQIVSKAGTQQEMRVAESLVRDKNDAPILAAFLASGADYLVTGDKDLLSIGRKDIINSRKALEILGKPAK
ncbi:MAG: putative toxin-antitoxin system toxin component, PIN family [Candidatus Micrarchaeia archaeon]